MICPSCRQSTLRLSPQRKFHDCHACGYSVLAPGVIEQEKEARDIEEYQRESHTAWIAALEAVRARFLPAGKKGITHA